MHQNNIEDVEKRPEGSLRSFGIKNGFVTDNGYKQTCSTGQPVVAHNYSEYSNTIIGKIKKLWKWKVAGTHFLWRHTIKMGGGGGERHPRNFFSNLSSNFLVILHLISHFSLKNSNLKLWGHGLPLMTSHLRNWGRVIDSLESFFEFFLECSRCFTFKFEFPI